MAVYQTTSRSAAGCLLGWRVIHVEDHTTPGASTEPYVTIPVLEPCGSIRAVDGITASGTHLGVSHRRREQHQCE